MQSVEFRVLDGSLPKTCLICSMQHGIRVASPTNSTESRVAISTPIKKIKIRIKSNKKLWYVGPYYQNMHIGRCKFDERARFSFANITRRASININLHQGDKTSIFRRSFCGGAPLYIANLFLLLNYLPVTVIDSSRHYLKEAMNGATSSSRSSLLIALLRSSSSIKHSQ